MDETTHPIRRTREIGQSIWLDDIHRGLLASGRLQGLVEKYGLAGVTSNPAIIKQAITDHDDYNKEVTHLRRAGLPAIQKLIAEGINVNATLLFSPLRYSDVHQAVRRIDPGSLAVPALDRTLSDRHDVRTTGRHGARRTGGRRAEDY